MDDRGANRGFTILEMLVVLTIVGLMMTIAPAVVSGLDGSRLRAASFDLVARLREARSLAESRATAMDVVFDLDRRGTIVSSDSIFRPLPAIVDRIEIFPAGLVDDRRIARLRFMPDGTASSARIELRRGRLTAVVIVDWLTGRIWRDG